MSQPSSPPSAPGLIKGQNPNRLVFAMEQKHGDDLFEHQVAGVHVWPLVRFAVSRCLMGELGEFRPISYRPHVTARRWGLKAVVMAAGIIPVLAGMLLLGLLRDRKARHLLKRRRYALFGWPKSRHRKLPDGSVGDPISWPLRQQIPPDDLVELEIVDVAQPMLSNLKHPNRWADALADILLRLRHRYGVFCLPQADRDALQALSDQWGRALGIKTDMSNFIIEAVEEFRVQRWAYRQAFRWWRPDILFVVVHYTNMALCAAARDAGAKVVDVQHGIITPWHLGYGFPTRAAYPYSPHLLALFGGFWRLGVTYPRGMEDCVIGTLQHDIIKAAQQPKTPRSGVIICQPTKPAELCDFALSLARLCPDWSWVFCPHPQDDRAALDAQIAAGGAPGNLKLMPVGETTLDHLARAEIQLGMSSTAIYEGLALGCRSYIVNGADLEYMVELIKDGHAIAVDSPQDMAENLDFTPNPLSVDDIFSPLNPDILGVIEQRLGLRDEGRRP